MNDTAARRPSAIKAYPVSITGKDTLKTRRTLTVDGNQYDYFSIEAAQADIGDVSRLPFSLKVLLENLLRYEDGRTVSVDDVKAVAEWLKTRRSDREIAYRPARVLMQDFTGVPAVADLAAMRKAIERLGSDPARINPLSTVDLVIDHSVMVDYSGTPQAFDENVEREFERNGERYAFLRWGQTAFDNFRVVPPASAIRSISNISPRRSGSARRMAARSPIPTPWSAPTAIPRW
jgi:aconitate hydratase